MKYVECVVERILEFEAGVAIPDEYYRFFGINKDARTAKNDIKLLWKKHEYHGYIQENADSNYCLKFKEDLMRKLLQYCRVRRNILNSIRIYCYGDSYEIQFTENDELKGNIILWFVTTTLALILPFIALVVMHKMQGEVFPNALDQFQNGESMLSLSSITIPFFFSISFKKKSDGAIKRFFAIILYAVQIALYCCFKVDSSMNSSLFKMAVRIMMTIGMIFASSLLYYAFQTDSLSKEKYHG